MHYKSQSSSEERFKIEYVRYNGKEIHYDYVNSRLNRVTFPENQVWEYQYYTGTELGELNPGNYLKSVKTPHGALIEYTYTNYVGTTYFENHTSYVAPAGCFGPSRVPPLGVRTRTVTLNDRSYQYQYSWDMSGYNHHTRLVNNLLSVLPDSSYTTASPWLLGHFVGSVVTGPDYKKEQVFSCPNFSVGNIDGTTQQVFDSEISNKLFLENTYESNNTLVSSTYYQWKLLPLRNGTYHASPTWASRTPHQTANQRIDIVQDGNEYSTLYRDFNAYGRATISEEFNNIHDKKRFTWSEYGHNTHQWILHQPTIKRLSDDGSDFTQISRIDYHTDGIYGNRGLPKDIYRYGSKVKSYTQWHSTGELKRVEDSLSLSAGSGKRYREYNDYYRGLPRSISSNGRYSATAITASRKVNDDGQVTETRDFNGIKKYFSYDNLGRLKTIQTEKDTTYYNSTDWLGTLYKWDVSGGLPRRTMKRCQLNSAKTDCVTGTIALTQFEYFDSGLRLKRTHAMAGSDNRYINYDYNSMGQQTFASFPGNSATVNTGVTQDFDALGRLTTQTTSGGGTVSHHYLSGGQVRMNNARGYDTTTTYRAYGTPQYDTPEKIIAQVNTTQAVHTEFDINLFGDITKITQSDGGNTERHEEFRAYDSNHYLCKINRGDIGITVFSRNLLGELTTKAEGVNHGSTGNNNNCISDRGATDTIIYSPDNLGDMWKVNYPDASPDITYTRDNNGNITRLQAGSQRTDYQFNNLNLPESEALLLDGRTFKLEYTYNPSGALSSLQYPNNDVVEFAPNGFGDPTKAARGSYHYASGVPILPQRYD